MKDLRRSDLLGGLALSIWGFVEIGCLPGNAGSNSYGPNPIAAGQASRPLE